MLRTVYEVLCATRRHRILLGVAAAILPLVVILILLEIGYRQQAARDVSSTITGALQSPPPISLPKLQLEPDQPRSSPLAPRLIPLAPPAPTAEVAPRPADPPQPQTTAASRDPVPLPRARPNRF